MEMQEMSTVNSSSYHAFTACTVQISGLPRRAVQAVCGYCHNSEKLPINTSKSHGNDDDVVERLVREKFENIGWLMGKTASQHRCPSCFSAIKASRKRKDLMATTSTKAIEVSNKIVQIPPLTPAAAAPVKPSAQPPWAEKPAPAQTPLPETDRKLTRDDRRIIFQKIDEVYGDGATGYSAGWSDKRIAADLGVPVIWVSNIRDENFGPNIDEAMVALINEGKAMLTDIQSALDAVAAATKELNAAVDRAVRIDSRLKEATASL